MQFYFEIPYFPRNEKLFQTAKELENACAAELPNITINVSKIDM
jgi:hypothetical protein